MNLRELDKLTFNNIKFEDLGNLEIIFILFNHSPKTEKPIVEVVNSKKGINSKIFINNIQKLITELVENYIDKAGVLLKTKNLPDYLVAFKRMKNRLINNLLSWPISCRIEQTGWIFKKPIIIIRPASRVNSGFPNESFKQSDLIEDLQYIIYQITLIPQDNATKEKIKDLIGKEITTN